MTPYQIIQLALKDAGIGGSGIIPSAEDMNDAFTKLNGMLAQWQRKRWLIWHLVDTSFVSTGATSYTAGPGLQFNFVSRPDKLESAFVRQLNSTNGNANVDYPLEIIPSWENYSRIALKQLQSFPQYVFYDSAWPTGLIYPWPVPQANIYEVHVQTKEILSQFSTLTSPIVLPPEYLPAIEWNLVLRLAPAYGLQVSPDIRALAKDSLNVLRMANAQVADLSMPGELVRNGVYNPYSDQIR